jgi:hypothetical protein
MASHTSESEFDSSWDSSGPFTEALLGGVLTRSFSPGTTLLMPLSRAAVEQTVPMVVLAFLTDPETVGPVDHGAGDERDESPCPVARQIADVASSGTAGCRPIG